MTDVSMADMQNYFLNFFGGIQHPVGETVEELTDECEKDKENNERQSN